MPICDQCNTRYLPQTYQEPAEPCECGANSQLSYKDYEFTEEELWEREAMLERLYSWYSNYLDDPSGGQK